MIFNDQDKEAYEDECEQAIKWIKVTFEEDSAVWLASNLQVQGHEQHWRYPSIGQWLPYNVVIENDQELPPPRSLFRNTGRGRTTMT